jgi:YHS domain-containing protein
MTPERQEANSIAAKPHFRPQIDLIAIALVTALWQVAEPAGSGMALASTTERIVTNRYSGLAIEGFDPLAYFVDGRPEMGLPEFEAAQGGVVWRFCNEGNRASFVAHPEVYAPQFGGYDPVDLARGVTVAGNPLFWLVAGNRLYLFAREDSRDAFAANPLPYLKEAKLRWPALEQQLAQ